MIVLAGFLQNKADVVKTTYLIFTNPLSDKLATGKAPIEQGCGDIVCMREEVVPIDAKNCFIPCNLI